MNSVASGNLANRYRLHVTFVDKDGVEIKLAVSKGDNLLDIAQANDIEMEGTEIKYAICSPS